MLTLAEPQQTSAFLVLSSCYFSRKLFFLSPLSGPHRPTLSTSQGGVRNMFFVGPHIRSPGDCHRIDRGGMDFLPGPLSGPLLPSSSNVAWGADREHLSNVSASSRVRPPPHPWMATGVNQRWTRRACHQCRAGPLPPLVMRLRLCRTRVDTYATTTIKWLE